MKIPEAKLKTTAMVKDAAGGDDPAGPGVVPPQPALDRDQRRPHRKPEQPAGLATEAGADQAEAAVSAEDREAPHRRRATARTASQTVRPLAWPETRPTPLQPVISDQMLLSRCRDPGPRSLRVSQTNTGQARLRRATPPAASSWSSARDRLPPGATHNQASARGRAAPAAPPHLRLGTRGRPSDRPAAASGSGRPRIRGSRTRGPRRRAGPAGRPGCCGGRSLP